MLRYDKFQISLGRKRVSKELTRKLEIADFYKGF